MRPASTRRTHATMSFLCTSNPAHRGYTTSMSATFLWAAWSPHHRSLSIVLTGQTAPAATVRGARGTPGPTLGRARSTNARADLCAATTRSILVSFVRVSAAHGNFRRGFVQGPSVSASDLDATQRPRTQGPTTCRPRSPRTICANLGSSALAICVHLRPAIRVHLCGLICVHLRLARGPSVRRASAPHNARERNDRRRAGHDPKDYLRPSGFICGWASAFICGW
jgi:hypothetical protein